MKKILTQAIFTLVCAFTFCLASCNKATYLRADMDTIEVESDGETNKIVLHSDGSDFQLLSSPGWVMAMLNGNVLKYSVTENTGAANREGEIVITCGEQRLVIKVFQSLSATKLTVDPTSIAIPKEGGTFTVNVDTDASNPTITAPEGFTATYAEGVITIVATPEAKKEGAIVLKAGKLEATVELSEKPDICPRCGGSGRVKCTGCNGEGTYYYEYMEGCYTSVGCDRCDGVAPDGYNQGNCGPIVGSGKMKCPACGGSGKQR